MKQRWVMVLFQQPWWLLQPGQFGWLEERSAQRLIDSNIARSLV